MSDFLARHGWDKATRQAIAGDASARQYTRLHRKDGQSAILMQDPSGDVGLFARLARHLTGLGLSAPRILAQEPAAGLLLIEDLGDGLVARLATDAETEKRLYLCGTDALIALHRHAPPPGLPLADAAALAQMTDLAFTHYTQAPGAKDKAIAAFLPILTRHAMPADVMILRDYHAENLLYLPGRDGAARAGLLDFQDAMQGHRAYDLVSLLRDVRRDVHPGTEAACISHYCNQTGQDRDDFLASFNVLGVQRNLRILGVFARLATQHGKPRYLEFMPRVWSHLQHQLTHPALVALRPILDAALPAPTPEHLNRLRSPCPTP